MNSDPLLCGSVRFRRPFTTSNYVGSLSHGRDVLRRIGSFFLRKGTSMTTFATRHFAYKLRISLLDENLRVGEPGWSSVGVAGSTTSCHCLILSSAATPVTGSLRPSKIIGGLRTLITPFIKGSWIPKLKWQVAGNEVWGITIVLINFCTTDKSLRFFFEEIRLVTSKTMPQNEKSKKQFFY